MINANTVLGVNGDTVPLRQGEIVYVSGYGRAMARTPTNLPIGAAIGVVLSGFANPSGAVLVAIVGVVRLLLDDLMMPPRPGDLLYVSNLIPGRASVVSSSRTVAVTYDVSAFARDASVVGVLLVPQTAAAGAIPAVGVGIPDADASVGVEGGSYYTLPIATAARTITLGNTGSPIQGEAIIVDVTRIEPNPVVFKDDTGTTLFTVPGGVRMTVTAAFTGLHFAGARAVRIQ